MNQKGVSFLEVIVVVAITLIVASLVAPNISDWISKRSLLADYQSLISQLDYLKTRARLIDGTSVLTCSASKVLSYQISTQPQMTLAALSPGFQAKLVESPSSTNASFNILTGNSSVVSPLCTGFKGIFLANGLAGLEGSGAAIDIELNHAGTRTPYGAFRVVVNQTTGFVQKYRWNQVSHAWIEQD